MTDLREISHILGLKVTKNKLTKGMWLAQPAYFDRMLERFPGHRLFDRGRHPWNHQERHREKRRHRLRNTKRSSAASNGAPPVRGHDISFSASFLARYTAPPNESHWQLALGVTAYLASTSTVGLTLGGPKDSLKGCVGRIGPAVRIQDDQQPVMSLRSKTHRSCGALGDKQQSPRLRLRRNTLRWLRQVAKQSGCKTYDRRSARLGPRRQPPFCIAMFCIAMFCVAIIRDRYDSPSIPPAIKGRSTSTSSIT